MLGLSSIWHWLVVLVIIILVFGTKKLGGMGKDLGAAIRGFKEGIKDEESMKQLPPREINSPEAGFPPIDVPNRDRR